jgi:hypothetical protein
LVFRYDPELLGIYGAAASVMSQSLVTMLAAVVKGIEQMCTDDLRIVLVDAGWPIDVTREALRNQLQRLAR